MTPNRRAQDATENPAPAAGALGSVEDLFGSVFESLTSSLVVFDRRLNVLLCNQAAKSLLPDERDVVGALSELTLEGTYVDWAGELRTIMKSQKPRHFDAKVPQVKDKPETYVEIFISPLISAHNGEVIGGLLLADDVSSRISMERRLAVSERLAAVGKLAARVAHELNNPLDGVLRYANLALRHAGEMGDEKAIKYLNNVKTGITRMTQIIGALLEFSRSAPGAIAEATINKIVEDAVTAMDGRARDSNITIVCNFNNSDMPVVRGSSIFQVCCNLIKNSIDAMGDSGTLTITTDLADSNVIVTFEDTGVGLPDDIEKIFEPFFTTKARGKGTGLGLAVCRELTERYSGTITADRREPCGSIFTITLPVKNLTQSPVLQASVAKADASRDTQVAAGQGSP